MNCAACQHENPDGSAFCEECGARFARRCPACGSVCAPTGKFCRSCGTALAPAAAALADDAVARKVITIVFADLIGSTSLHERLDPESVSRPDFGTLREGGAFESVYVRIGLVRGDRIVRVEMFEPENLDVARARFEELREEAAP